MIKIICNSRVTLVFICIVGGGNGQLHAQSSPILVGPISVFELLKDEYAGTPGSTPRSLDFADEKIKDAFKSANLFIIDRAESMLPSGQQLVAGSGHVKLLYEPKCRFVLPNLDDSTQRDFAMSVDTFELLNVKTHWEGMGAKSYRSRIGSLKLRFLTDTYTISLKGGKYEAQEIFVELVLQWSDDRRVTVDSPARVIRGDPSTTMVLKDE